MKWALLVLLLLVPQEDTELLVLHPQMMYPTALHSAVWDMVEGCTGRQYDGPLEWAAADTLVGYPSGAMAYGVLIRRENASPLIVIERPFFLSPSVISHEIVHLLSNGGEASPEMERCVMSVGLDMPERVLPSAQLESVRGRALRVGVS